MKSPKTLLLDRKDLRESQVDVNSSRLDLVESFGLSCSQPIREADIVIFVDTDKTTRILKNAYGRTGLVAFKMSEQSE